MSFLIHAIVDVVRDSRTGISTATLVARIQAISAGVNAQEIERAAWTLFKCGRLTRRGEAGFERWLTPGGRIHVPELEDDGGESA